MLLSARYSVSLTVMDACSNQLECGVQAAVKMEGMFKDLDLSDNVMDAFKSHEVEMKWKLLFVFNFFLLVVVLVLSYCFLSSSFVLLYELPTLIFFLVQFLP